MNKKAEIKNRIDLINRGEVPEGYKCCWGYICPESWNIKSLKDLFYKVKTKNTSNESLPVLSNSATLGVILQDEYFDREIVNDENTDNYYIVENGDFMYNPRISSNAPAGPINRNTIGQKGIASPLYTIFRAKDTKNIEFVEKYFKSNYWHRYMKSVSNQGARHDRLNITDEDFMHMPIPQPLQQEQEKIAKILNCCDKVIELKQKLLEEKNKEKKWLVKNLIQPKTILNCNDKTYKEYEFEDVIIKLPTKKYQINTTEYLTIGKYPVVDQGKNKIIAYCNNSEKLYKCPINGIIVFGDHTREIKYIDFDFVIGADGTQILSVQNGISVKYIYYYLLNQRIPNTGYNRHYKFLKNILFMIPSQEKQKHVVQILSKIDNHIEYLEQELKQYKQLKKSLSQLLLTGIVRTVEVDCEN